MKIQGIYKITSPIGKVYIGSSIDIKKRIQYYKSSNCKGQIKLYNSINKYGWINHVFEIVEECNLDELNQRESFYGKKFNVLSSKGLNLILPNSGDERYTVSEETRLRMSNSKKGSKNFFYGCKHTKESRLKISKSRIGKTPWNKGKKCKPNISMSKKIINTKTNEVYNSIKHCSQLNNINYSTLRSKLNGSNKNDTIFDYV